MAQQIPVILARLFNKKKDWDYCTISIAGRGPIAIEPTTKFSLSEDGRIFIINDPEAPNPFVRGPLREGEPETVSLESYIDTDLISSVDFINFPKIVKPGKSIIT